jgi:DUF1009 family protein
VRKLGLIAGGGQLPIDLADYCRAAGRPVFVLRLRGFTDTALSEFPGAEVGIAELGRQLDLLRREGCEAVCFCGVVKRPDFAQLKPDLRALRSFPAAVAAASKGDDALLRFLIGEFEKEGFLIEGADEVAASMTLAVGPIGLVSPGAEHQADIRLAVAVAKANGALDVGQGAVAAGGVVLAVEAQEGTDAMLGRCAELPAALRGVSGRRIGVLAKWPKPIQERRIDLPTLGAATIEGAAAAGLAGVVAEAGATLIIDRSAVIAAADRLGLFVVGLEPDDERA